MCVCEDFQIFLVLSMNNMYFSVFALDFNLYDDIIICSHWLVLSSLLNACLSQEFATYE